MNSSPGLIVGSNRENIKVDGVRVSSGAPIPGNPPLTPAMTVPFYAGTEVWSTSTPTDPWATQGQFIHQIDDIRYQHYPGYQTTGYQQTGFIADQTSAFQPQYANTNGNSATSPAQGSVTPRSTGSYTQVHTPTPSPNPPPPHVNGHRNGINVHYVEENYVNGTTFGTESTMVPPASTTPNSRSSSVHIEGSDTTSKTSGYMSGNEIPGYPLNSPQCQSSCNSSGYPGQSVQSEYGDQTINGNSYQTSNGQNHVTPKSPSYTQASPGAYHNYQNYNQGNVEDHQNAAKSNISPGNCHPSQKSSGMYNQSSPKNYNSNPSPQNYQEVNSGQNRNVSLYENRSMSNGNIYQQNERYDQQNYPQQSPNAHNYGQASPNNANQEKSNVNARIKSMIMNKQQLSQSHQQNLPNNNFSGSNENQMMSPSQQLSNNVQIMQQHSPMMTQMMSPIKNSGNQHLSPPNHHHQQQQQQQQQITARNNQTISSNSQINSRDSERVYVDKIIHQNDYGEKKDMQMTENSNHFLAFSHHLRDGSKLQPEGGGAQCWTGISTLGSSHQFSRIKSNYSYETFAVDNKILGRRENNKKEFSPMENFAKYQRMGNEQTFWGGVQDTGSSNPLNEYLPYVKSKMRQHFGECNPTQTLELTHPTKRMPVKNYRGTTVGPVSHECNVSSFDRCLSGSGSYFGEHDDCFNQGNVSFVPQRNLCYQNIQQYCVATDFIKSEIKCESDLSNCDYGKSDYGNIKTEVVDLNSQFDGSVQVKIENEGDTKLECEDETKTEENVTEGENMKGESRAEEKIGNCQYPRISYAPNFQNMKVIDRRFMSNESEIKPKKESQQESKGHEKKENYLFEGEGGPITLKVSSGAWCCRLGGTEPPSEDHLKVGDCQGHQTADELCPENGSTETDVCSAPSDTSLSYGNAADKPNGQSPRPDSYKDFQENVDRLRNNLRTNVPECQCFPPDKFPPEPGSYYTHLGAAASLSDLRKDLETRTGQTGKALRFEKICYTGKEGKTTPGCPLAKWVIRRSGLDEKVLIVVKHRQGHTCSTAWIVVCLVAWEGVPTTEADRAYSLLSHKLNKFGLPTTRRCATNEPRTCACQGLDPDTCGASFSFGCSWSMYYNGCKYARSKTVRKFRLSVRSEEQDVEERMHVLATLLSPLYNTLAPDAFHNQTLFEREATECRLGFKPGRPFSGVTACIDFCAHSHRDLHNMNNGCTVVVTLTKHRSLTKPDDEQLHVLPLYIMDDTDEFGCKNSQEAKCKNGSIECLNKFPCEVRVRAVPLQPCRRHGKKRKEEDSDSKLKEFHSKNLSSMGVKSSASSMHSAEIRSMIDSQVQSSQVSSTVIDSPGGQYKSWPNQNKHENEVQMHCDQWHENWTESESQKKQGWMNSASATPHWDYSGYPDNDVNPDSTSNQSCPTTLKKNNSRLRLTPYTEYSTPELHLNESPSAWNQMPQPTSDGRNFCQTPYGMKIKQDEEIEGKMSPIDEQQYSVQYQSYSAFRIPKGRPPLTQGSCTGQSGTYLKPLHKEYVDGLYSNECKNAPTSKYWLNSNVFGSNTQNFQMAESYSRGNDKYENFRNHNTQSKNYSPGVWLGPGMNEHTGVHQNTDYSNMQGQWESCSSNTHFTRVPQSPKSEPIGEVTDFIENEECFKDSQMGGVAIALGHGSVLFECAKHELHATTALKNPNRLKPTRISLVFYQHRNLNRAKHGWEEWEEKMRLRKLGVNVSGEKASVEDSSPEMVKLAGFDKPLGLGEKILLRSPTYTTTTWTTLFPMRPCMVTGPYQEEGENAQEW
ncbi:hypothetical protein RUM43_010832 [Polyplax serrata]|uniref:Methylcytosine dioxygenase TET n=1 Tax=Polyplax serrata TaxID=468196 RepID=A0AAN8NXI8_POLSC